MGESANEDRRDEPASPSCRLPAGARPDSTSTLGLAAELDRVACDLEHDDCLIAAKSVRDAAAAFRARPTEEDLARFLIQEQEGFATAKQWEDRQTFGWQRTVRHAGKILAWLAAPPEPRSVEREREGEAE